LDYSTHTKDGYGQDGLLLKNNTNETEFCPNCGKPLIDGNKYVSCAGCNLSGCKKCMILQPDYNVWLCKQKEINVLDNKYYCQVECFCCYLETLIDKLRKQLQKWINSEN